MVTKNNGDSADPGIPKDLVVDKLRGGNGQHQDDDDDDDDGLLLMSSVEPRPEQYNRQHEDSEIRPHHVGGNGDGGSTTAASSSLVSSSHRRTNSKSVQFSKHVHSFDSIGEISSTPGYNHTDSSIGGDGGDAGGGGKGGGGASSIRSKASIGSSGGGGGGTSSSHAYRSSMTRGKSTYSVNVTDSFKKQMEDVRKEKRSLIFLPWSKSYKVWFSITVAFALTTVFVETYAIGFLPGGLLPANNPATIIELCFMSIFVIDIIVTFNLAYQNDEDVLILDRRKIARNYIRFWFWIDLIGVYPFYLTVLGITGNVGVDTQETRYMQLLRLLRLVRLYRIMSCFEMLQYSSRVSLLWLTLVRDFGAALMWTHFAACAMFFIARQSNFQDSWLETPAPTETNFDLYLTSLYWSIVTFTTVGYGDYSPVNAAEQIFGMTYMFFNMIFASWVIGSITLLVVKNDEKNGQYRDDLKLLEEYSQMNNFGKTLKKRLKTQLKLDFNNREISDENVLQNFPRSLRRKVLRKLYYPLLQDTSLMHDVKQSFVDQFLNSCSVELFGPGEEILQRGSLSNDLYLLVDGVVQASTSVEASTDNLDNDRTSLTGGGGSIADSDYHSSERHVTWTDIDSGDFVNAIPFFTEAPNIETVKTASICKTLTMPSHVFKAIAEEHPGCASTILQNLLQKVKQMVPENVELPKRLEALRVGSAFDIGLNETQPGSDFHQTILHAQAQAAHTTIEDLIQMHINKQKDDNTTRFLFAASRSDMPTLRLMLNNGLDPNSADYDRRNALHVASMNGNTDVVRLLLDYHANPNLVDVHGTSALYEAVKGSHDETIEALLENHGELCMSEEIAATTLCQCVFNGDLLMLKRLCKAGININAGDYDGRTAVHIAASEGNLAAVRVLSECGADLSVRDRWDNSIEDEAKRANAVRLLEFLDGLKKTEST